MKETAKRKAAARPGPALTLTMPVAPKYRRAVARLAATGRRNGARVVRLKDETLIALDAASARGFLKGILFSQTMRL